MWECVKLQCSQSAPSPELLLAAGGAIGIRQPWTRCRLLSQSARRRSATCIVNSSEKKSAHSPLTVYYTAPPTTSTRSLTARYLLPTCLGREFIPARSSSARCTSAPQQSASKSVKTEVECYVARSVTVIFWSDNSYCVIYGIIVNKLTSTFLYLPWQLVPILKNEMFL